MRVGSDGLVTSSSLAKLLRSLVFEPSDSHPSSVPLLFGIPRL